MTISAWPIVSVVIAALGVLIGILVAWKKHKDRKSGFPAQDERTQKIQGKAATYALYIGSYSILAFLGIQLIGMEFFGLPDNDAGYPLIAALLVYNLLFLVLRWLLGRKGDN
jgi:uncharacterized Tic20 family protein